MQSTFSNAFSAKYILAFDTGPLQPVGATVFQIKQTPSSMLEQGSRPDDLEAGNNSKSRHVDYDSQTITAMNDEVSVKFDR